MQNQNRGLIGPLAAAIVLMAMLVPAPAFAATQTQPSPLPLIACDETTSTDPSRDVVQVQLGGNTMVEKLRGEAALTHLYNLFSRQPEAFKAAREALTARGFEPTTEVYVERTVRLTATGSNGANAHAVPVQQYSEQNEDGEVVYWSWDDGDDNTWEGTIYVEVYSTGDFSNWEGQIDASNEDHEWVYYQKLWDGGGPGGDPIEAGFNAPPRPAAPSPTVVLASWPPQSLASGTYTEIGSWDDWAKCYRACVVGGCAATAIGCIATGPAWPACFGFGCVGAQVGCGITCFLLL